MVLLRRARCSRSSTCDALRCSWPKPRYFNLYGPTETNVCTCYEVVLPVPDERDRAVPDRQGLLASALQAWSTSEGARRRAAARKASCASPGRGVMQGYWALPEQTARAFLTDADGRPLVPDRRHRDRGAPTATTPTSAGAIAWSSGAAIASSSARSKPALYRHAGDQGGRGGRDARRGGRRAHHRLPQLRTRRSGPRSSSSSASAPSTCRSTWSRTRSRWHDALPKTSTDKIDYQRLKELA